MAGETRPFLFEAKMLRFLAFPIQFSISPPSLALRRGKQT
jgi:hypothetical protein